MLAYTKPHLSMLQQIHLSSHTCLSPVAWCGSPPWEDLWELCQHHVSWLACFGGPQSRWWSGSGSGCDSGACGSPRYLLVKLCTLPMKPQTLQWQLQASWSGKCRPAYTLLKLCASPLPGNKHCLHRQREPLQKTGLKEKVARTQ